MSLLKKSITVSISARSVIVLCYSISTVQLFVTPWTVARQASPSMGFSRQEYWRGLPIPSPGDLTNPGIESGSPALQAESLLSEPPGKSFSKVNERNTDM